MSKAGCSQYGPPFAWCCSVEALRVQSVHLREEVRSALQDLAREASGLYSAVVQHANDLQTGLDNSTEKVR